MVSKKKKTTRSEVMDQACIVFTRHKNNLIMLRTLDGNDEELNDVVDSMAQAIKALWEMDPKQLAGEVSHD